MKKEISQRVLSLIKQKGISKYELCKKLDIPPSSLDSNLSGVNGWKAEMCSKLANFFNVSLDWLINGSDKDLIAGLQDEISILNKTIQDLEADIYQARQFIIEHLENKQRETTGEVKSATLKGISKPKGKKN